MKKQVSVIIVARAVMQHLLMAWAQRHIAGIADRRLIGMEHE